ncbi:PIN domain-containing protein [Dyadobacter sp. CY347]|uniref:type II toxin-antitoxin system VapC family toxin n=1 Tax=Dyadobacter sp. CY347 TaxID=2909336 RepID=UPI001F2C8659|nr:PIN domain-containing protein [Dyadobacter sp. CY347]MCF2489589.1 PIN domain-containing protein [Dyadobacter sp. CY347]
MASKVFLDANILLDFLLKRDDYQDARQLIEQIVHKQLQGFITPAIVHILGYWLTKAYGKVKAKELILSLMNDLTVIDCNHQTTLNALNSKIDDIEDALQYYAATQHKLHFFISRDKNLQKHSDKNLPIFSIKEFLALQKN